MSCIVTHPVPNARGEASLDLTPFKAWYCAPSCWPAFACGVGPSSLACLLQGLGVPAVIGNIGFVILCFLKSSSHLFPSALCADTGLPFYKTYHSVQVLFLCPANGVDLFKTRASVSQWPGTSLSLCKATGVTVSQLPPEWTAARSV